MPWTTTYLFFLLVFVISKLFYKASLLKPILSFVLISFLFATYFFLLTYADGIEIIEYYVVSKDASIRQAWTVWFGIRFTKRLSMEVLLIGLCLLFFHGLNKLYPMTFYKYPGCSIVVTILLYLLILVMLMGL